MTSFTKPEIPVYTCKCGFRDMQVDRQAHKIDRQTDRQTDTLITIIRTLSGVEVK